MGATFEVTQPGLGNTIQDAGRPGYRHQGVPVSGWLDAELASCANALVGNAGSAAALEMRAVGPTLRLMDGLARLAVCGQLSVRVQRSGGPTQEPGPWCSFILYPGDSLVLGAVGDGCAYLACAGGWDVPVHMGSRSTYNRVGLGGLHGRALQTGDRLQLGAEGANDLPVLRADAPFEHAGGPIRVMAGPQTHHFAANALDLLLTTEWRASTAQDRMGVRLTGPALAHAQAGAADMVSDAVTPGAIQVPADGQPIVLLADCQTMGGYPKIAVVIAADVPRLAHMPAGSPCRFVLVDAQQAAQAQALSKERLLAWQQSLKAYQAPGWLDERALLGSNLIDGMIDAGPPE